MPVVAVGASKGGVGKSTIAYELAAALGGVLVDLDWDSGGATRMGGYDPGALPLGAGVRRATLDGRGRRVAVYWKVLGRSQPTTYGHPVER